MTQDRFVQANELSAEELTTLRLVAPGFMGQTIPQAHQARLVALGLIQLRMGGLMATPAGRMLARQQG